MSRPYKHPKTGVYYFRKAVPDDLRAIIGKREEKVSLGTKVPAEAKIAHAKIAAEVENRWKALRSKPEPLTHRQIVALAGDMYRELVNHMTEEPGEPGIWDTVLQHIARLRELGREAEWFGPAADKLLQEKGISTDEYSRERLIAELVKADHQAAEYLKLKAEGDYRPDPNADRFPEWQPTKPSGTPAAPPAGRWTLTGLVEDWWKESKAAGLKIPTYESYSKTMAKFVAFLGHDDATRVTGDDVVAFKNHRLAELNPKTGKTISPKTVKDSDLSGLKSIFSWAVSNRRMAQNPATGITIKLGKTLRLRPKGFTDDEAQAILKLAWTYVPGREHRKLAAAKRWSPWLCAYSGARIGEMVQLRKEDLRLVGDHWVLTITPEAGPVKTNEARDVVLHSHLVEMGFPAFIASCEPGYLFMTPHPDGEMRGPWRTAKNRITEFVRTVVTDPNVQPNHGWRHRLKTVGMEVGMAPRVLDAIQGHAPRTAGDTYGDVTVKALALEVAKLPRYEIG
jgi:integrase